MSGTTRPKRGWYAKGKILYSGPTCEIKKGEYVLEHNVK